MKGRIFVVNHSFIENLKSTMEVKANLPPLKQSPRWFGSLISLLADMFQTQLGDYIFFEETKGNNPDSYIWGVYRVISNPFFDPAEPNFIKLKIEPAYIFENPLIEYDILNDPYKKTDLWNIVGKKVAGKPRASTQLSAYETEFLIQKLIDKNKNFSFIPYAPKDIKIDNEIKVNYDNFDNSSIASYSELDFNKISYIKSNGTVQYEKVMELVFNLLVRNKDAKALGQLNISLDNIMWYANYLPYSLDRSEFDYIVLEASDKANVDKINVIEFQKGTLDKDHIKKAAFYANWINSKLANGANLAQPIVICENFKDLESTALDMQNYYCTNNIQIYTMNLKNGIIQIDKRR